MRRLLPLLALAALAAGSSAEALSVRGGRTLVYTPALTPTASSAAIQTAAQTFTVTGLDPADSVVVNGPAPTSLCPMVGARVSAANTLQLHFAVLTAAACTPAAGTYRVLQVRP